MWSSWKVLNYLTGFTLIDATWPVRYPLTGTAQAGTTRIGLKLTGSGRAGQLLLLHDGSGRTLRIQKQ